MLDSAAATEMLKDLGPLCTCPGQHGQVRGEIVSFPTDGWTQLVVYRSDLFQIT